MTFQFRNFSADFFYDTSYLTKLLIQCAENSLCFFDLIILSVECF